MWSRLATIIRWMIILLIAMILTGAIVTITTSFTGHGGSPQSYCPTGQDMTSCLKETISSGSIVILHLMETWWFLLLIVIGLGLHRRKK